MKHKQHVIKKIGFYDSGLGGLFVMSEVRKKFPNYDYVFLADEKNLPYGTKTSDELLGYARVCLNFLILHEECDVVVVACNTLSATVYETLERECRASHPDVLLFDVIMPTIDELDQDAHFSVFGTPRTIESHMYRNAITSRFPDAKVDEYPMAELASVIEMDGDPESVIRSVEKDFYTKPHTCVLACTHYGLVEADFKKVFPQCNFILQHRIITDLLSFVLHKPGKEDMTGTIHIYTTKQNSVFDAYVRAWFGEVAEDVVSIAEA